MLHLREGDELVDVDEVVSRDLGRCHLHKTEGLPLAHKFFEFFVDGGDADVLTGARVLTVNVGDVFLFDVLNDGVVKLGLEIQ